MRKLLGLFSVALIMVAFQNCSKVAFDSMDSGLTKSGFVAGPVVADVIVDGGGETPGGDVVIVDEGTKDEENQHEDKKDQDKHEDVVVADDESDDEDKKDEDKKDEDMKDDVVVADDESDDDKDDKHEENDDDLSDDELDLIACASDEASSEKKVLICHYPPGNADARKTKCIGRSALKAHMSHGGVADTLGACSTEAIADSD